jgi:diguanylate cyclase (GGDEF)-like protein
MACVHLALLVGDWLQGKHMLLLGLSLRVGLCIPLLLLAALLLRANMPMWLQGLAAAGPAALTFLCDQWLALHLPALQADRHFMGTVMGLFTSNLLLALRPQVSIVYNAVNLAIFNAALFGVLGPLPMGRPGQLAMAVSILVLVSTGIRWRSEIQERRTFLLSERDRLHTQQLAWANRHLTELSYTDPLTGLANRRFFEDALKRLWHDAQESGLALSILMIDIDYFKHFNDTFGHDAGDKCLRRVAQAMQFCVRVEKDSLARYGGEEFIAVIPGTSLAVATQIAERIRTAVLDLQIAHPSSPLAAHVTACIGVATTSDAGAIDDGPETLLHAADFALYVAKSRGRNCVVSHQVDELGQLATFQAAQRGSSGL